VLTLALVSTVTGTNVSSRLSNARDALNGSILVVVVVVVVVVVMMVVVVVVVAMRVVARLTGVDFNACERRKV
jgi:hypothetical protein